MSGDVGLWLMGANEPVRGGTFKGGGGTDPLAAAQEAHRAALAAQEAMRRAAHERDQAVKAARAAGVPAAELATALGVNRHRIHAMLKKEAD